MYIVISYPLFISEEEEVDKMMEQKLKEEEERKRKKEMEERMSLEETKEQVHLYDCCVLILGLFTKGVVIMLLFRTHEQPCISLLLDNEDGSEAAGSSGGEASAVSAAEESPT